MNIMSDAVIYLITFTAFMQIGIFMVVICIWLDVSTVDRKATFLMREKR